jgi:hypothetical protein
MKQIMFSRFFPAGHPRAKEPTRFIEGICIASEGFDSPFLQDLLPVLPELETHFWSLVDFPKKNCTIRAGKRWKERDVFQPKVWSGRPYFSKTIPFGKPLKIKDVFDVKIKLVEGKMQLEIPIPWVPGLIHIANEGTSWFNRFVSNDGFSDPQDFVNWFKPRLKKQPEINAQIIAWNDIPEITTLYFIH